STELRAYHLARRKDATAIRPRLPLPPRRIAPMSDRFILLSGCSGGGKSTLLEELGRRGHATVEEPGRRIVEEELAKGGTALPWLDLAAFARRAIAMALADREAMRGHPGYVFFDRGLIDAAAALEAAGAAVNLAELAAGHRYNSRV